MSRCFPFPPPGYEKKLRPEDEDLLKEEKRKEKKHKKEKKDREKKEGKEKRDKDRSDGKHREKKDKKDKHRDKKEKHKDKKDKDKETSSISEEARVSGLPEASYGQKLPRGDEHVRNESINSQEPKCRDQSHGQHGDKLFKTSLPAVETKESKFVQELARRIRDEQKAAGSQLAEGFPVESKRDEKTNTVYIKDSGNLAEDKEKNKEKKVYNNKMDGQAVGVEPRIGANAILPSFPEVAKSKSHGMLRPLEGNVESREEKEKSKERRDEKSRDKKKDKQKDSKSRKENDREKEKKKEEKAKDKSAHRKSEQYKSGDVKKSDCVSVSNTKLQVPLVPKDNIAGIVTEGNSRERKDVGTNGFLQSRDNKKSDFVGVSNTKLQVPLVPKDNFAGIGADGNPRKRKDFETNGFLHENEVRPAKLLRPSSSLQPTQNGKRLETHQRAGMLSSHKQGVATDIQMVDKPHSVNGTIKFANKLGVTAIEVENKEHGINGTIKLSNKLGVATNIEVQNKEHGVNGAIKGQPLALSKPKPLAMSEPKASSISPGAEQIAEASKRPPHPDSKYLDRILSVPKMEEWSGFDDQDWLFGSRNTLDRKPQTCLDEIKDNQVWSEALQIDSADVCALPYVIPY